MVSCESFKSAKYDACIRGSIIPMMVLPFANSLYGSIASGFAFTMRIMSQFEIILSLVKAIVAPIFEYSLSGYPDKLPAFATISIS